MVIILIIVLMFAIIANVYVMFKKFLNINYTKTGDTLKIRPKVCSNALGEEGTCMFVWECIKTEGKHLGTCNDGFLFGSCCGHNDTFNSIDQTIVHNTQHSSQSTLIAHNNHEKPSTVSSMVSTDHNWLSHSSTRTTTTTSTRAPNTWTTPPPFKQTKPTKPFYKPTKAPIVLNNLTEVNNNVNNVVSSESTSQLIPSSIAKPWPSAPSPIHCK